MAARIADAIRRADTAGSVLEIGPGRGALTAPLVERFADKLFLLEIDRELAPVLRRTWPLAAHQVVEGDALRLDWRAHFPTPWVVAGNFPYNISGQLIRRMVVYRHEVIEMVGMFQREVAQRLVAEPGGKTYGLPSVLAQTFFHTEYLFALGPGHFNPPPRVHSAVVRMEGRASVSLPAGEALFLEVVKAAFGQRRKTLRNALRPSLSVPPDQLPEALLGLLNQRAETLSPEMFVHLSTELAPYWRGEG